MFMKDDIKMSETQQVHVVVCTAATLLPWVGRMPAAAPTPDPLGLHLQDQKFKSSALTGQV